MRFQSLSEEGCLKSGLSSQAMFLQKVFQKKCTHHAFLIWPSVALVRTLWPYEHFMPTCEHPVIYVWWPLDRFPASLACGSGLGTPTRWSLAMICWPWICWAATVRRRRRNRWSLMFVRLGDFWLLTGGKSDAGLYCERRGCDIEAYCMGCVTIL